MALHSTRHQLLVPSLEELQAVVNQAVQSVTDIGQGIPCWTTQQQSSGKSCAVRMCAHFDFNPLQKKPVTIKGLSMIAKIY